MTMRDDIATKVEDRQLESLRFVVLGQYSNILRGWRLDIREILRRCQQHEVPAVRCCGIVSKVS